MAIQLKTHGVREFEESGGPEDVAAEEIRTVGYAVIDSGYDDTRLETIRERMDAIYAQQIEEIGGEQRLRDMNDADIARALLAYDDLFLELATHPTILGVASRLLGEAFILMSQNAIINRPTDLHYQVTWHRDLNYQHFVSSRPLALSALYAIDPFSEETGGTYLLPATHKVEKFPSGTYTAAHERVVEAPAGSILLFDAMLYHRSGTNRSGRVRRAVNHIITLPLIKQQISFPLMLDGRYSDDPFLRRYLGYDTQTGESVTRWRQSKLSP